MTPDTQAAGDDALSSLPVDRPIYNELAFPQPQNIGANYEEFRLDQLAAIADGMSTRRRREVVEVFTISGYTRFVME